jgi:hypothetical protein
LQKYADVQEVKHTNLDTLKLLLKEYTKVIIGFHKADGAWKNHNFTATEMVWIDEISKQNDVILDCFVKPYALSALSFENSKSVIVSYQNSEVSQIVSAQLLFGVFEAQGKLPVSINETYQVNHGLTTEKLNRLGFTSPKNVGMNPDVLIQIDQFMNQAIADRMTPGGQILVARKGKVIYQKAFGYQTYDKLIPVKNSDLYDVASLTKIMATLPNVMQLYDRKVLTMDSQLGDMLPLFKNTDKSSISFKDL